MLPWDRGIRSIAEMVEKWWKLGLVRPVSNKPGGPLIERERLL
jgi:hypothetical protein